MMGEKEISDRFKELAKDEGIHMEKYKKLYNKIVKKRKY